MAPSHKPPDKTIKQTVTNKNKQKYLAFIKNGTEAKHITIPYYHNHTTAELLGSPIVYTP